jgi:hypothetical protein
MEGKEKIMASCEGDTLEYFVEDSFMGITIEQEKHIVRLLEPEREWIEYNLMWDYDEETMSWRDYRNGMWYNLEDYDEKIRDILKDE